MNERSLRNQKGAAVTGLVLALFLFIMLCGFFTFDASRLQMAQRELTATCDAAALAGTAMLTSYDVSNDNSANVKLIQAQSYACGYARNMFQAGNLLGRNLTAAVPVSPYSAVGVAGNPGDCNVMISLADPLNNYAGVPPTSPQCINGRAVMVYAGYTYAPIFLGMIGVGKVVLNANSGGGLPQVDTVLVFDYSGSMDDATNVTFVRRTWDSTKAVISGGSASSGAIDYRDVSLYPAGALYPGLPAAQSTGWGLVHYIVVPPPTTGSTSHQMAEYLQHDYTNRPEGLNLNVLPPMNLHISDNSNSMVANKYVLDWNLRVNCLPLDSRIPKSAAIPASMSLLMQDYGSPPGNCTLATTYGFGSYYDESSAGTMTVSGATANCAYNTNPLRYPPPNYVAPGAVALALNDEHPASSASGVIFYNPINITGGDKHTYTDMVVNIGDPGGWPYNQPITGPTTFVNFSFTFPAQEPDTNLQNQTFTFENLGVVVEAARGNLDSSTYFSRATLDRGSILTTSTDPNESSPVTKSSTGMTSAHCKANYQKAYQRLAMLCSQPLATAIDGAYGGFLQKINSLTDARFGLVGFSNASCLANTTGPNYTTGGSGTNTDLTSPNSFYISSEYCNSALCPTNPRNPKVMYNSTATTGAQNLTSVAGGSGTGFRQPRSALDQTLSQANSYGAIAGGLNSTTATANSAPWSADTSNANANGLENGRPLDNTDTYEAINTAYKMFHNGSKYDLSTVSNNRPAAKHAIVFFTDGVPTGGSGGADATSAQGVAATCKGEGIAIFCIGLNLTGNSVFTNSQITFMGNTAPGLSGAAGNGGKFFPCAQASDVRQAFAAVARRLSQSQR